MRRQQRPMVEALEGALNACWVHGWNTEAGAGRGGLSWIESMEDPRGRRVRAEEGVSDVV